MSIRRCAQAHFDKHVIKMIIEYCQLLCTAWYVLNPNDHDIQLYKPTHINHPSAVWVRQHVNNYMYVAKLGIQLCKEWRYRYQHNRIHGCESKLLWLLQNVPSHINQTTMMKTKSNPKGLVLPLSVAMPAELKPIKISVHRCVIAYRKYYQSDSKVHLTKWSRRPIPKWFITNLK